MKWIGQHIYDFVSRFRNDVYLEDVSTGTIASGGNLGLDSNNKIVKATVSSGSGDITEVNITTDSGSGSKASETSGSADFSILGSNGVNVTNSGTTITATAVPSEIDHDSLNNFTAAEHFPQSDITTVGTIGTGVWQGTAIASAYMASATDSAKGAVELATVDEATAGTGSGTAVTPVGLESHVSARFSYQYINFIGNSDGTSWATPTQNGSNAHQWTNYTGETGTSVGSTTISVGRQYSVVGFTMPYAGQLMGFYGTMRNHNNNNQGSLGLFVASGSSVWGSTTAKSYTLRAMGSQSYSGGAGVSYQGGCKVDAILGSPFTLAQGDIIIPAALETTADKVYFQMTMVIRTLIPT